MSSAPTPIQGHRRTIIFKRQLDLRPRVERREADIRDLRRDLARRE